MREILFRGKTEADKWVFGSLIATKDYCCILQEEEKVHPMDYPYLNGKFGTIDGSATPVILETVGQYTGLTDNTKWENLSETEKQEFYNSVCSEDGKLIKWQRVEDVKHLWKGKRIFEGDIVKSCYFACDWIDRSEYDISLSVVRYEDGCFMLSDTFSSDGYNELSCVYNEIAYNGEYGDDVIFEVVGNIHDNPKLLKEGSNE